MKKIILIMLILLPFMGWAIDGDFLLKGKIGNGSAKSKIYLKYFVDGKMKTFSASCQNGVFQFKATIPEPKLAQLLMDYKGVGLEKLGKDVDALVLILEKAIISVDSKGWLKDAVVTGSKLNDENRKFRALLNPIETSMNSTLSDFYRAPESKQKNEHFKAETEAKLKQVALKRREMLNNYVKGHPGSFLSLQTLMEALDQKEDVRKIKILFNSLSPELRNSPSGKILNSKL